MTRSTRGLIAAVPLAVPLAVLLAGCGPPDVTRDQLETAVAHTFAGLYDLQQDLLGDPSVVAGELRADATCDKGGPATPDEGAGPDWVCLVYVGAPLPSAEGGTVQRISFEVTAKTDGCFTADGPPLVVGQQTLARPGGGPVVNPLFEFDGCFDTS